MSHMARIPTGWARAGPGLEEGQSPPVLSTGTVVLALLPTGFTAFEVSLNRSLFGLRFPSLDKLLSFLFCLGNTKKW